MSVAALLAATLQADSAAVAAATRALRAAEAAPDHAAALLALTATPGPLALVRSLDRSVAVHVAWD
jgi:hypothetical protein